MGNSARSFSRFFYIAISAAALFFTLPIQSSVIADDLPDEWCVLSVAAARLHYVGHVLTRQRRTKATDQIIDLNDSNEGDVRDTANALLPLLDEVGHVLPSFVFAAFSSDSSSAFNRHKAAASGTWRPAGG